MSDDEENFAEESLGFLTSDQKDSVSHLQEIVGSLSDSAAVIVLRECNWSLERAVNKVLGLPDPSHEQPGLRYRRSVNANSPVVNLTPPNQRILRISDTERQGWWWIFWMLFEPIRFSFQLFYGVARIFVSFLWPDPRTQVTDPVGDVQRFIEHYRNTYMETSSLTQNDISSDQAHPVTQQTPPFYVGSYAQALQEAKQSLRFLIVYLHGDSHEDTKDFCCNTLQNENLIRYLSNTEEFVLWGCNIKSPEGYRVSRTLREHTYPFIGVIGLTNLPVPDYGPHASHTLGMALLGRIEGAIKPNDLIEQLKSIMNEHQGATIAARLDRQEREENARIREEQDLAYEQSLAQDRAKMLAREQELRSAQQEAEEREKHIKIQEAFKRARANRQAWWKAHLPPAPKASESGTVQLMVMFPDGRKLSRVFWMKDSSKILYYFVLSYDGAPENFEIQKNFPRQPIPCQPNDESDLEDYLSESDKALTNQMPGGSKERSRKRTADPIEDWALKSPCDPPTFETLGLSKPELLFVVDCDA